MRRKRIKLQSHHFHTPLRQGRAWERTGSSFAGSRFFTFVVVPSHEVPPHETHRAYSGMPRLRSAARAAPHRKINARFGYLEKKNSTWLRGGFHLLRGGAGDPVRAARLSVSFVGQRSGDHDPATYLAKGRDALGRPKFRGGWRPAKVTHYRTNR